MALLDALAARDWARGAVPRSALDVLGRARRRRRARAALRRRARSSRASAQPRDEIDARARRAATAATCPPGPSGSPDARPRRRAADRAQLLLRRPARAARPSCRGTSGGGSPTRCSSATCARRASCRAWSGSSPGARRRCAPRATTSPRSSPCSACGPTWHPESRRVTGIEVIPLEELGRPRDRRHGAHLGLLPRRLPAPRRAARRRGRARSPRSTSRAEHNFVAAHARADAERLAAELGDAAPGGARRRASSAPSPGTYGAGPAAAASTPRDWRDDADLAEVYEAWGGYAYGRGLDGARAARGDARLLRAHRGRGQERRLARARHPRLRRLLPVPRRHGRDRARADRRASPRPTWATARTRRASSRARWPRRRGACSAPASPTRAGSRR